jgi:hypothetical protein
MSVDILIYKNSKGLQVELNFDGESIWATQKQLSQLFQTTTQNITGHLKKIYNEEEILFEATCKEFLQVQIEGNRKVERVQLMYNLDAIISVGYRINSKKGTQFRQWATQRLKDHLIKGYTINEKRLLELNKVLQLIDQNKDAITNNEINEAKGLDILSTYTKSFILLNKFDSNDLNLNNLNYNITYEI